VGRCDGQLQVIARVEQGTVVEVSSTTARGIAQRAAEIE
jgi:hypothetical protein